MKAKSVRIAATVVFFALAAAGCGASVDGSPEAEESAVSQQQDELAISREAAPNTRARTVGGDFGVRARRNLCDFGGPCECYLDGIKTSCSLVAACLASGNCVVVKYVG